DFGLTFRQMTGEFVESTFYERLPPSELGGSCSGANLETASNGFCLIPPQSQTTDIDLIAPMLYTDIRFDLPLSGFFVGGTAKAIAYDGNEVTDLAIEGGYMFDMTVLDIGLALGYRRSSLKADDLEGLYSDATLDGFYTSLKVHF
ncbi:MAG TPA: hypothetical protein VIC26_04230, partial [Marinagarivorans sp.]